MADVKLVTMQKDHPAMTELFPISEFNGVSKQMEAPAGLKEFVAPEANIV